MEEDKSKTGSELITEIRKKEIQREVELEMAQLETPKILREIADELFTISSTLKNILSMLERP